PEIKDDAVVLDEPRMSLGVDGAETSADHLDHHRLAARGAQQDDAARRLVIPAFGQHRDVDGDLGAAALVAGERYAPFGIGKLAMDEHRLDAGCAECVGDVRRVRYRRTEDDGLAIAGLLTPMVNDGLYDGTPIHDRRHLAHVELAMCDADRPKAVLDA